jgi:aromatic-amino-acid transaminase
VSADLTRTGRTALIPDAARRPGDDPIFSLNAEARRRALSGESILNATLGALTRDDGSLAVMPSVAEVMASVPAEQAAAYAPIAGTLEFLSAVVADVLGTEGLGGQAVAVATPGGSGAVHHAFLNFLEPGESALTSSYYWGPYRVIADHARRGVEVFRMLGPDLRFDLSAFEAGLNDLLARQGRALVILNFPCHNPTGYSLDDREWEAVADIVVEAGKRGPVTFLLDWAYERFGAGDRHQWLQVLPRLLDSATVLVAWTASKAFTQYGSRTGALVAVHPDPSERRRLENALNYSCRATWSNCNHRGQVAVARLLREPELRDRSERERRELLSLLDGRVEAFNEHAARAGLRHPRYVGGFFVSVLTPDGARTAEVMRDEGVFVVPIEGAVRVALCSTPREAVPRLVEALRAGVDATG